MKRILLAILLIPVLACGQETLRGLKVGDNGAVIDSMPTVNGQIAPYVSGSKSSMFNDSIVKLVQSLSAQLSSIQSLSADVQDLQDSITQLRLDVNSSPGDTFSLQTTQAFVLEGDPDSLFLYFEEDLGTGYSYDSVSSAFSYTAGGNAVTIDSIHFGTAEVYFATDSVFSGQTLYLNYTEPGDSGLADPDGNTLNTFTNLSVDNRLVDFISAIAEYKLAADVTDNLGNYNGSAYNTPTYQGDTAMTFAGTGGDQGFRTADFLSGNFSVSYRIFLDENANENYYHLANNTGGAASGFHSYYDGTGSGTFNWLARCGDGGGSATATTVGGTYASSILDDTWYDVVEIWTNVDNGDASDDVYAKVYIDGTCYNCDADTIITGQSPMTESGAVVHIGSLSDSTAGLREGAKIDEVRFYDYALSQAQIDSLDLHPFRRPYGKGSATLETETGNDTVFTKFKEVTFSSTPLGDYSQSNARTDWYNTLTVVNGGDIVVFDGDTVLESVNVANSKYTGMNMYGTTDQDTITELYFSYNVYLDETVSGDWDWTAGSSGKMPGPAADGHGDLEGTYPPAGGEDPYLTDDGCSGRGGWNALRERFGGYLYHHDQRNFSGSPSAYGESVLDPDKMPTGQWVNVTARYVMNSVASPGNGNVDGIFEWFINGECKVSDANMQWRNYTDIYWDWVLLHHFFGGSAGSSETMTSYFDDFTQWQYQSDIPGSANYPNVKTGLNQTTVGAVIPLPNYPITKHQ